MNTDPMSFQSRRSPVFGTRGMVAASQPQAAAAGLEILSRGGNAADAAVAVAAALNVTEPTSTGIGGDCFALFYEAATHQVYALNGSGRAPQSLTIDRLRGEGLAGNLPPLHAYNVTVPGACAGWCDLVERFGALSMSDILSPAIRLGEEGFPVTPVIAYFWDRAARGQLSKALNGREMTIDGRAPRAGEIFRNPGLARTFKRIAEGGKDAYYKGEIAAAISKVVKASGGCMEESDLAAHRSTWDTPISTIYRGIKVWECPPNGQGLTALLALNLLEGFDLASLPPLSTERLHLEIEAFRLAFADSRQYVCDPAFSSIPLEALLSSEYSAQRRALINPQRATLNYRYGELASSRDTVYFCTADGQGNACSFINSNYMGFGTGIVPTGWGFSLQNRGANFSHDPQHPNALAPGKRPYHTIIPGMATRPEDGSLYAAFGVMGGFMQPQGHMQVLSAMLDDGLDPQSALDRPRFCLDEGMPDGTILLEEGTPPETVQRLAQLGHDVRVIHGFARANFGRGQIILRDPATGVLCAGSDPRADGCAMTF